MTYRIIVHLIVITLCVPCQLFAEDLKGKVMLVYKDDTLEPAVGIDVVIEETGDSGKTKAGGLFRIFLEEKLKVRGSLTLSVSKPGWVIQYPLDGQTLIPTNLDALVQVRLLPKGSKKLLSGDRIEKWIRDAAEKAKTQQVKPELPQQQQAPIEFGRYIKDWAIQYGFTPQQAKAEIDKWVGEVEEKQEDFYKVGLAEYYKKNFRKTYDLASESGQRHARAYELNVQEGEINRMLAVRDYKLAGDAAYSDYRFNDALRAYTQAQQYVSKNMAMEWAALQNDVANQIGHSVSV
jgi:hypothetical protein